MKIMILIFIVTFNAYSNPIEVRNSNNNMTNKVKIKKFNRKLKVENNQNGEIDEINRIDHDSKKIIKEYLNQNSFYVMDLTNRFDIKTGSAIKGILLNSVVSSNLDSPILVETTETFQSIPKGSRFGCLGVSKNKRVLSLCSKLIMESDEYEVDTILLNNDGTAGLLGKAYSGREQYAASAITGAALKGALDVSLDRMNTSYGSETVRTTSNNKIKSGAIGALDEVIQMNTEEYKNQETKISIEAGTEVLVYFNKRFKL